jgi:tetratricopeptide (TPR) repeat protein
VTKAIGLSFGLMAALAWAGPAPAFPELEGESRARIQNIEQHLADWQLDEAKAELAQLKKLVKEDNEAVHYFSGRVAFEEGRYADAVAQLTQASNGEKTPGSWQALAADTERITRDYERAESAHFIFLYPKGKDAVLAPWALETLESIRSALEQDLGWLPKEKVRVEVVSNAKELAKVSTLTVESIRTTGTIAICKFNKLMVTSPKAVIRGYDWQDTLAHEYVHFVVGHASKNTVPIWMHEGLAKYLESRWRGPAGGAMTPSTLALLGSRVRKNQLVPFEKMHPSMALLPTAEDASTAFAEVFFAIQMLHHQAGPSSLKTLLQKMAAGATDRQAVEASFKQPWPAFEKAWMAHLKTQPFPKELIPPSSQDKKELAENAPGKAKPESKKGREISFGDFAEVKETDARKWAHLGELMRERNRTTAAAEDYGRARALVGDRYEALSNKYALTLLELKRFPEAQAVLEGSLKTHPGSAQTNVHLGRLLIRQKDWARAKNAFLDALAANPFDEEIHLSLVRVGGALHDNALADRARIAASALLAVSAKDVDELARALGGEDLVPPPASDGGLPTR